MSTLYELTSDFQALWDMIDDPEVDEQIILDTLEGIDGEIEIKADGYAKVIADATAKATGIKAEEDRLSGRRKAIENNIKRIKSALQNAMEITGKTKFKTDLFSFNIQNNPPHVEIADDAKIPEKYMIPQNPKIDSKAIASDLKLGIKIEGCTLSSGKSLRIR